MIITSEIKKIEEMGPAKWVIPYHDGSARLPCRKIGPFGRLISSPTPGSVSPFHTPFVF
jgi:hypothetical protein